MINKTKIVMISFFVLAFILVIGSSTITHYVKQNTAITSVKGFTILTINGQSILFNTSASINSLNGIAGYKYYLATGGMWYGNFNFTIYNSQDDKVEVPSIFTIYDSAANDYVHAFNSTEYANQYYKPYDITIQANIDSDYSYITLIGYNMSMVNASAIAVYNSNWINFTASIGQAIIIYGFDSITIPNNLNCQSENYNNPNSNYAANANTYLYFCESKINGLISLNTNFQNKWVLVQKPQTYNFNSIFSYQSLEGQLPSCVYSYGYKPNLTINGNQISVYSAQNITQNLSAETGFISYNNLNFSLTGMTYISANLLANVNPNLKILNSNSTILDISSGLEYQNAFYSDLNTSTENKNLTFNVSTYNEKLINTFLSIGTNIGHTQIQAKNTNSSVRYPIKLNLTIDMPITNYNRQVYVKNINFTISSIGRGIYTNATSQVFDVANFLDIFNIQNKNYTETNTSITSFTINYNYNNYVYIHNSNSANYGNYIQVNIPITIYYFVNTTKYPYALANFTSGFNVFVNNLTYMYSNGDFSFSTLDSVPLHAVFNSSNSEIVNPSGSEIYNETYTNSSFIPYLYFSFSKYGNMPGQLELLVNGIDQSSSAKFEINGKNYSTSGSVLDLNLNSSTIYENNYAYFVFNNVAQKVPFTIETISFNPCLLDQPIVLYKIKDNISANGSITAISTCYNGICNVPQNITNSTIITTTNNVGFSFKGTKTFFGMSYVSIGALSFILTNQFLYMVFMLFVLLILAKKYKHDKMLPYVVFALFTLMGFGLGLVNTYIFAMFMLVLVVAIANSFKKFLPIGT